jgi:hypothetical protein
MLVLQVNLLLPGLVEINFGAPYHHFSQIQLEVAKFLFEAITTDIFLMQMNDHIGKPFSNILRGAK